MIARKLALTGAFLSCSLVAGIALAEAPISEDARGHFSAGVNFLQDPDGARYEEAYREFRAAYSASPSWKILGNLGIAAFKLERDGEAIDAFKKYLAEGGAQVDGEDRAQFERDLKTLESAASTLRLQSTPAGATILDERIASSGVVVLNRYPALTAETALRLRPGHHRITAKLQGHADLVWETDLEPRQDQAHTFTLVKVGATEPSTSPSADSSAASGNGLRTVSYVALGVGAVGIGVGSLFGLKAKSEYTKGNDLCPSFPCALSSAQAAERKQHGEDGDQAKTLAIVGFAAGGVGLVTGITLMILSGRKSQETARAGARPFVGLGSVGVEGAF